MKHLRDLTGSSLLGAKRLCDTLSGIGALGLPRRDAELLRCALDRAGEPAVLDRW